MSRFIGGKPPAGYTGSGPVKSPTGPRGPIKPKPGTKAPSTGGRGPVTTKPVRPRGSQPGKPVPPKGKGGASDKQIAARDKFKEMIAKKKEAAAKKK